MLAKTPGAIVKYSEAMTKPLDTLLGVSKKVAENLPSAE